MFVITGHCSLKCYVVATLKAEKKWNNREI